MRRRLRDNRGSALILTILVVGLIVVLTVEFNSNMRAHFHAAANVKEGLRLVNIAKSGVEYAVAVLFEDAQKTDSDTLNEIWADSKALSSNLSAMFEEGRFEITVQDHSGKIQINQLVDSSEQKDLFSRFLSQEEFGLESEEIDDLIDAITDWIDPDDEVTGFGAENTYYQSLPEPYSCKNGPFDFLEDLMLVRGVTKELFYGKEGRKGLSGYLTVHGDGKININTADTLVLMSLSEDIDRERAEDMIAYRNDKDNNLDGPTWYKKVPGMSDVVIAPSLVTTSSIWFDIESRGIKEAMYRQVNAMVKREGDSLQIISWKTE
ncbi:MAG: type II secretion system minor pseudopilin GspK [Desulfatiglans sp.]|jgi:general secretion pathway protein K|nr:type II secretion system minor pseudopilin GspK [Thermodesulfobacteriota bacterium]MEE4352889.1 type II secretion system minor pseudopilin GspK [Desulfatiglans sp.]